jgi:hypothetical protein
METTKRKERMASSEKWLDEIQKRVMGIVKTTECCTNKFHVSEFFSAKCVKWKRSRWDSSIADLYISEFCQSG